MARFGLYRRGAGRGRGGDALAAGTLRWRLSPLVLFGHVSLQLENPLALSQPVRVEGSWSQWQVSPAELMLPAEGLSGLGAPLNTLAPSGVMRLSWTTLELVRQQQTVAVNGRTVLVMNDMGSRMTPIKPLGSYELVMDWRRPAGAVEPDYGARRVVAVGHWIAGPRTAAVFRPGFGREWI